MKYPMCADWLIFHRVDEDMVVVENYLEDNKICREKALPVSLVNFLRKLDGKTDPYTIVPQWDHLTVSGILRFFDDNDLIRYSNFVEKSLFSLVYTIHVFHPTGDSRVVAYFLNALLIISFLPVLITGALLYASKGDLNDEFWMAGVIIGLIIGLICHEAGHAIAGLAYGARLFEAGVLLRLLVMPGAYVMLDDGPVKKKLRKVQIYAAGVEMNLLLTGISLILSVVFDKLSGLFWGAAMVNLLLGLLNALIVNPLDGSQIINVLLGKKDLVAFSREIVLHGKTRKKIWNKGLSGKAVTIAAYVITTVQIALPIVVLFSILGMIIWIKDLF